MSLIASSGNAQPLVVGLLLAAIIVGGIIWLLAGRAAEHRAVERVSEETDVAT